MKKRGGGYTKTAKVEHGTEGWVGGVWAVGGCGGGGGGGKEKKDSPLNNTEKELSRGSLGGAREFKKIPKYNPERKKKASEENWQAATGLK